MERQLAFYSERGSNCTFSSIGTIAKDKSGFNQYLRRHAQLSVRIPCWLPQSPKQYPQHSASLPYNPHKAPTKAISYNPTLHKQVTNPLPPPQTYPSPPRRSHLPSHPSLQSLSPQHPKRVAIHRLVPPPTSQLRIQPSTSDHTRKPSW